MPDYGTYVTDAKGVLHDLTRHAFDAYNSRDKASPLNVTYPSLRANFTTTYSVFKKHISQKL